ncbi:MAG: hypothetical protein Q8K05_09345 [Polaromonas sp.]|nr:hypothetical protein [Polaromonas sp.]MDP2256244.1 hypothetical protein [Polaromonas sp.]MDP3709138.1 hypothetical protein [Polaromonas sp.]
MLKVPAPVANQQGAHAAVGQGRRTCALRDGTGDYTINPPGTPPRGPP